MNLGVDVCMLRAVDALRVLQWIIQGEGFLGNLVETGGKQNRGLATPD